MTIADDSGLEVEALRGLPGPNSARYAGEKASSRDNNQKLLKEMEGIPLSKRKARFRCVLALVSPEGREAIVEGSCQGRIGLKEVGKKGFGYDPLFFLPQYGRTMAELSIEEKTGSAIDGGTFHRREKQDQPSRKGLKETEENNNQIPNTHSPIMTNTR